MHAEQQQFDNKQSSLTNLSFSAEYVLWVFRPNWFCCRTSQRLKLETCVLTTIPRRR